MVSINLRSETIAAIYRAYEADREDEERHYLGASVIGQECERALWYGFRWCSEPEKFDGRQLRLFATGHREEARMIDDLRRAGLEVYDRDPTTGKQIGVSAVGGHFRGHMDGVARGFIEAPKTWHLVESKTHNDKNFAKVRAKGVREAKPEHYAQMTIYMELEGLTRGFYYCHNKGDDELHAERVEADPVFAMRLLAKAEGIITALRPPAKLHEDPKKKIAFACGYCHQRPICHEGAWSRRNCRTCAHSTPMLDGDARWVCERHKRDLTIEDQRAGCAMHLYIPELVPHDEIESVDEERGTITYQLRDGSLWTDGPGEE
jgi:hypothetical protein